VVGPWRETRSTSTEPPSGRATSNACCADTPGSTGGPDRSVSGSIPRDRRRRPIVSRVPDSTKRRCGQYCGNSRVAASGPPVDPGVSALHALLVARPDGGWELVDLDSTNGTTLGDGTDLLAPNTAVALAHGDRIKLGAWTTITVTFSATPG